MKIRKRRTVAVLILCMVMLLGSALAANGGDGVAALFSSGNNAISKALVSLRSLRAAAEGEAASGTIGVLSVAQDSRVTWEIVTNAKTGASEVDTEAAVLRFTLTNPGAQEVSFNYTVVSGSAERGQHLRGTLDGSITLSASNLFTQDVTVEVKPLADNPGTHGTANNCNALWTGDRVFYLFCDNISNALFDGGRHSLTLPVPITSAFDYQESYETAANTALIDLDSVPGGANGVYPLTAGTPLTLTGAINGDVRTMLDAGVFTHILLPGGYLSNRAEDEKSVTYIAASYGLAEGDAPRAELTTTIAVPAVGTGSLYSEEFTQYRPIAALNLGPNNEGNGIIRRLDFTFTAESDGVSVHFADGNGEYAPKQVRFSDETAPTVIGVSAGSTNYYGDNVPVVITFSEPVYTDGITFKVNGESLRPMEKSGTISESVSFLYTVGDEALGSSAVLLEVTEIAGARDLSNKAQTAEGSGSADISIADFDPAAALLYCAQPEATVEQGTNRAATVNVSVPLKADTELRAWLADSSRLNADNISAVLKARAITAESPEGADIALTVIKDTDNPEQAIGLTGSFTAPENTTGAQAGYVLEFYLKTGSDYQLLRGLTAQYTIPPLILVDDASDVTLSYTGWPSSNSISASTATGLSLGYTLNVDATWQQNTYFVWSSSNESVATIDNSGNITVLGAGTASFTLTVSNPLNSDIVTLRTPSLTVVETGDAYLYVPTALQKQEVLRDNDARVSFSTNLTARNEVTSPGAKTDYTFTLYSADYSGDALRRETQVWQKVQTATAVAPVVSCTVPAEHLQTATATEKYGYILEIKAADAASGAVLTAEAYIRVREKPAKAVLTRPTSLYLTDESGGFSVTAGSENTTTGTDYQLTVTRNSESIPIVTAEAPGTVTVPVSYVDTGRLMDVYTVSLQVKNPDDTAWSADSFCVYVYRNGSMSFLVGGLATGSLQVELRPNLKEDIIYGVNELRSRAQLGLSTSISFNTGGYAWSSAADQITWSVSGEAASLLFGGTRIKDGENLTLPPAASLRIQGDAMGTATVTATHARTGMSISKRVVVGGTDKLYLFQSTPQAHSQIVYTNGNGVEKTVPAHFGSVGVYEASGITSDVVFYPENSALYDFAVLKKSTLDAGQAKISSFDLYPVHTVSMPKVNYTVSLFLFDNKTGDAYTDDITVRGGLYVNGTYYATTKINEKPGNADQTLKADDHGRYNLSFDVAAYYTGHSSVSPSDELNYVIEVSFGALSEADFFPAYITVGNADIRAGSSSAQGVSVSAGITALDHSLVQNEAVVLSQSVTLDGEEYSLDDNLLKLEGRPSQALLNMTLMLPGYQENTTYYLRLADGTGANLGYAERGTLEQAYPFSDIVTLRFSNDISFSLFAMLSWHLETGEKGYVYPSIEATSSASKAVYQLSKPIRVQSLYGVRPMDWSILSNVQLVSLLQSISPGYAGLSASTGISLVDEALGIAGGVSSYPHFKLIGLELSSTEDPLVYQGVLRYAAGSEFFDGSISGGVYMREDDPADYSFLPDSRFTGEGKSAFMKRARRSGNSTYYLSGGAYIGCALRYNLSTKEWDLSLLKGDLYMGANHEYERRYNAYIGPVPVTAKFRTNMSVDAGLTILRSANGDKVAYIPRLSPAFSIYGSGGVGRDYKVVSLWAGPYGKAGLTQNFLWYTDSDGQTANGQRLGIWGEVGVAFEIKLVLYTIDGEYKLTSYSNNWNYNKYAEISNLASGGALPSGRLFAMNGAELTPVSQTISYTDRSYLDRFARTWNETPARISLMSGGPETETLQENANPDSAPLLADDGSLLAYLSDMDSTDLRNTAAVFAVRDACGKYPESTQISADSPYPDSDLALSGTASGGASAVWLRYFTDDVGSESEEEANAEGVIDALASSEVMAAVYKGGSFTTTRLTTNATPEMSPVTAAAGGKAVAAWIGATLGDLENPLNVTSSYLMYSVHDGSSWNDVRLLYDGSLSRVTALSAAMLENGTSAILYQVTEGQGDSELFCAVLNADGAMLRTLRLTDNNTEDLNPQLTAVKFSDGPVRFVAGWNHVNEDGQLSIQLAAVNADGTLYPALSLELSDEDAVRDYDSFFFSKGAQTLEKLSILWCESEDEDGDETYEYTVYGAKPVALSDGMFSLSGRARLLELPEGTALRALDARTDSKSEKIQLVMVAQTASDKATMSTAMVAYQNAVSVAEPQFLYAEVIPGLELPVSFTVTNDGMEPITELSVAVGDSTFEYKPLRLLPGDSETFPVLYPVPETVADARYTVTAQFGSPDETASAGGGLKLGLPDVEISQIDVTKQSGRERGFRVQLGTSGYTQLASGTHSVRLEVWDNPDFTGAALWSEAFSSADSIAALNSGLLPVNVTLDETQLESLLGEDDEIPDGGTWVYFRVVLLEDSKDTDDAESGNDLDYVRIYSLIERYGQRVSLSSAMETAGGVTTLRVTAANNAMQRLSRGSIVATLRDEDGNALETLQTYNGGEGSLLRIDGEESSDAATLAFSAAGYSADLTFVSVSAGSARLSSLNFTGVPLEFDPAVYEYNVQAYDLTSTTLTAVAEDPAATVSVKRGGAGVPATGPLSLSFGETVFTVTVTSSSGDTQTPYTVRIQNSTTQDRTDTGGSSGGGSQNATLKIGGVSRTEISVRLSGGLATVSLGELARDIFSGSAEATLALPALPGLDSYLLQLPAGALAGTDSGASLTISTSIAQVKIPAGMLADITGLDGKTAGIAIAAADADTLPDHTRAAVGNRPVLSFTFTLDGVQTDWRNPDAPVTVSVPYTPTAEELESPESIIIWYFDGSGNINCVTNGRYNPETGAVTFQTTHFSLYAVGYNPVEFADVAATAWYAGAVRYLAARKITAGTTATTFSPDATLTRGQFVTLLLRAYNIEAEADSADNFADAGNTYYTGYLAAAKRLDISSGVGDNKFAPEAAITRQEMFTLLYHALGVLDMLPDGDSGKTFSDFADRGAIAAYAQEAMAYLVEAGVVEGNNGYLMPASTTTRAQMAQVLYNLKGL